MYTIGVTIKGIEPGLLQHRFPMEADVQNPNPVKRRGDVTDTAQAQAELAAYRDDEGHLVQPAEHIFQALVKAAGGFQVKGQGKKTYKDALKGSLLIAPDYIRHKADEFDIDQRPVRIQAARVLRYRPLLRDWELSFTLTVIDDLALPEAVLHGVLVDAGQKVGIGDYRPRFGRFIVTRFERE
jgi:hypothetical protein